MAQLPLLPLRSRAGNKLPGGAQQGEAAARPWRGVLAAHMARKRAATSRVAEADRGGPSPVAQARSWIVTRSKRSRMAAGRKRESGALTWQSPVRCCWRTKERWGRIRYRRLLARVMATYRRRRSSSISSGVPLAMSDGMQPSTTLRTSTVSHSWPLAEWMVDKNQIVFVEKRRPGLSSGRSG